MKITYLKLLNFAGIFTAMKRTKLEIDFSIGNPNTIINILVGGNGSGKTTLLSMLQPFSYVGTLDIRSGVELILPDKDGYKEIHYIDNDDEYIIKHHYTKSSKGRTIKSFISKNGVELNENGNVTSFKELVLSELGIEQDHLKLIRLGSNVTNFINMKVSERKSFTTDLLNDIEMYNTIYKKISENTRLHSSLIKSVSDRINRLNIYSEDAVQEEINIKEEQIQSIDREIELSNKHLGNYENEMSSILGDKTESEFMSENILLKNDLTELQNQQKQIRKTINNSGLLIQAGDYDAMYKTIQENINELKSETSSIDACLNINLKLLNSNFEKIDRLMSGMSEYNKANKLKETRQLYNDLKDKISKEATKFEKIDLKVTKEELLNVVNISNNINKLILDISEYDKRAVMEVLELFIAKKSVIKFADNKMSKIQTDIEKIKYKIAEKEKGLNINGIFIAFKPTGCTESNCPYEKFYKLAIDNKKIDGNLYEQLKSLENKFDYYANFSNIIGHINTIKMIINTNLNILKKIPNSIFDLNKIDLAIIGEGQFFNEEALVEVVSLIEDYEDYKQLLERVKDIEVELKSLEELTEVTNMYNKELQLLYKEQEKIENEITVARQEKSINENHIGRYMRIKEFIETVCFRYKDIENEIDEKEKELSKSVSKLKRLNELNNSITNITLTMNKLKDTRNRLLIEKNNRVNSLENYKELTTELKELEFKYDNLKIIRESVSSNKGIPLLFIQLYLKNTKNRVNELLESVFEDLQIDDFIINDKEFRIPYIKNGIKVDDISLASQGEGSFISLAISFALIEQSISKYNILLLDEIDSALDITNRAKFIQILEKQLYSIGAEQVFMITHNNMFDSYPVNLIMTSNTDIDNFSNVTVIHK